MSGSEALGVSPRVDPGASASKPPIPSLCADGLPALAPDICRTEDDALDVVELMQESLLDAYTTETGEVDFQHHHSGSMSLAKQVSEPYLPGCTLHSTLDQPSADLGPC